MPHLLIVIEREGQLLIMPEDIPSHIRFHLRPHNMSEVSDIKITEDLKQHESDHQPSQHKDRSPCLRRIEVHDLVGNVSHYQRNNQRHHRS